MYEKYRSTLDSRTTDRIDNQLILTSNNDPLVTAESVIEDILANRESWGSTRGENPQQALDLVARVDLRDLPKAFAAKDAQNPAASSKVSLPALCRRVTELGALEALVCSEEWLRDRMLSILIGGLANKELQPIRLYGIDTRLLPINGAYKVFIRYSNDDLLALSDLEVIDAHKEYRKLYVELSVLQEDVEAYKALEAVTADPAYLYAECVKACATYLVDLRLFRTVESMGVVAYAKRMAGLLTEKTDYLGYEKWIRQIDDHYIQELDDQAKYAIFEWLARFNYRDNLGNGNADIRSRLPRLIHYVKLSKPEPERLHDLITKMHFGELELLERQGERFSNPELIEMCWARFSKKTFLETDLFKENAMPLAYIYAFTLDDVAEAPSGDKILHELFKRGGGKDCYVRIKDRKLRTKLAAQTLSI
ncbi:hypothetical protein ACYPKM_01635 [Pseudomonas aeruginosa]